MKGQKTMKQMTTMKHTIGKTAALALAALAVGQLAAFEYSVRRPSDYLKPTFHAADTAPEKWTLAVDDAIAKAGAAGKYTIILNTASWWCPYCETLEELVLSSARWKSYVSQRGFYLAMLDFPYRLHVSEDQVWKSARPDLGDGWGFKCWMMNPEYLAEIGLTENEGLDYIMEMYEQQKKYAPASGTLITMKRWDTGEEFTYNKLGYPTLIVIGPDGAEVGRCGFPWYRASAVTQTEAIEYVIQALERIIVGECEICQDSDAADVDFSKAYQYDGWLVDEDGAVAGTLTLKTAKYNGNTHKVKGSAKVAVDGKTISFPKAESDIAGCVVCGDEPVLEPFEFAKGEDSLSVTVGASGLVGTLRHGDAVFTVKGGRNVFKEKDAASAAMAAECPVGTWSLVVGNDSVGEVSPFARGYGALAMEFKKAGKVKFSGTMGDGTKVSCTAQAIAGGNGLVCVPFVANLYAKRGGAAFLVWFKNGRLLTVDGISKWKAAGKYQFENDVSVSATMSPGAGSVPERLDLTISDPPETLGGMALVEGQAADEVVVKGRKWSSSEFVLFNASVAAKTGLLSGSITFRVKKPNGGEKKVKGTFKGIVMGGSGYGSVVVKGEGSWAVKIALCGSCSD